MAPPPQGPHTIDGSETDGSPGQQNADQSDNLAWLRTQIQTTLDLGLTNVTLLSQGDLDGVSAHQAETTINEVQTRVDGSLDTLTLYSTESSVSTATLGSVEAKDQADSLEKEINEMKNRNFDTTQRVETLRQAIRQQQTSNETVNVEIVKAVAAKDSSQAIKKRVEQETQRVLDEIAGAELRRAEGAKKLQREQAIIAGEVTTLKAKAKKRWDEAKELLKTIRVRLARH
ncbi:hypothetical protein JCM5353_006258 [Sporobolomyces roseus]